MCYGFSIHVTKEERFFMNIYPYLRNVLFLLIILQLLPGVISNISDQYTSFFAEPNIRVGKVDITGTINDAKTYLDQIKELMQSDKTEALLLNIDSGGGSAGSSQALFLDIMKLKEQHKKPVFAWIENTGASGAYYVAAACDHIVATPSAFVGSIGVFIPQMQLKQFIQQFNINYYTIKSGKYKAMTDPLLEQTEEEKDLLQHITNDVYDGFTQDIISARPQLADIPISRWAEGKLFTARQGLAKSTKDKESDGNNQHQDSSQQEENSDASSSEVPLVDATGSLTTVEDSIRSKLGRSGDITYVKPTRSLRFRDCLHEIFSHAMSYISMHTDHACV